MFPSQYVALGRKTQVLGARALLVYGNCPVQLQDLWGCQGDVGGALTASPQRYQGSTQGTFSLQLPLTFNSCLTGSLQPESSLSLGEDLEFSWTDPGRAVMKLTAYC